MHKIHRMKGGNFWPNNKRTHYCWKLRDLLIWWPQTNVQIRHTGTEFIQQAMCYTYGAYDPDLLLLKINLTNYSNHVRKRLKID